MSEKKERLEFRGGMIGLIIPFCVMLAGILYLSLSGMALAMAFWIPALAGMLVALLLAKKPSKVADAMIEGIANETVVMIMIILLFAGMVAQIMKSTGLVEGLTWLCTSIGVGGAIFPLLVFIAGSILSSATGTAIGTVMALTPILYPVGVALGAYPPLVLGAIVSASYFGDNIAPVSDTTIASAGSQGVDVPTVVKSRLKYAFAAAAIAAVLYIVFGFMFATGTNGTAGIEVSPKGLIMMIVPIVLICMMLKGVHMMVALMGATVIGLIVGCVSGLMNPADILIIDMDSFSVGGILVDGMNGMMDLVVFTMLLMSLVHILERGGFFDYVLNTVGKYTDTPGKSEAVVAIADVILCFLTVANSVVILMEGPIAKQLMTEKHHIAPDRTANILDAVSCAAMCLIPYGFAPILAYSFAAGSGAAVDFNMNWIVVYAFHGIGLAIIMTIAIATGWGRHFTKES